ncbi:unnamed protein product [Didymodactylos carnosus]|uniref:Uncharacterized protein n=1 Tax=Didymodactylos carnosus TaxID=1234261 RepID=A0A815UGK1_9BILA|nr:unnamed protein product [Didymodactylos carnosus]CAF1515877.1 unnamed protein product [Didymodactylos carnosus]CAF4179102.1 unnamed protein product [Didymodactylos carnosus]CAF4375813.1 unnamed protein product [Didymodactylos carnosus]
MKVLIFVLLTTLVLLTCVLAHPILQTIVINGHEWIVPNEPGWEEVLTEADALRELYYRNCQSNTECRGAIDLLEKVFSKYPVSAKYITDESSIADRIFKWGR